MGHLTKQQWGGVVVALAVALVVIMLRSEARQQDECLQAVSDSLAESLATDDDPSSWSQDIRDSADRFDQAALAARGC